MSAILILQLVGRSNPPNQHEPDVFLVFDFACRDKSERLRQLLEPYPEGAHILLPLSSEHIIPPHLPLFNIFTETTFLSWLAFTQYETSMMGQIRELASELKALRDDWVAGCAQLEASFAVRLSRLAEDNSRLLAERRAVAEGMYASPSQTGGLDDLRQQQSNVCALGECVFCSTWVLSPGGHGWS